MAREQYDVILPEPSLTVDPEATQRVRAALRAQWYDRKAAARRPLGLAGGNNDGGTALSTHPHGLGPVLYASYGHARRCRSLSRALPDGGVCYSTVVICHF